MPFAECRAHSLTVVSIQKNAPQYSGVYGLSNAREWLFIGESDNIRAHLLELHRKIGTVLERQNPMGFTFELCSLGVTLVGRHSCANSTLAAIVPHLAEARHSPHRKSNNLPLSNTKSSHE